jgi:hypothetical protein
VVRRKIEILNSKKAIEVNMKGVKLVLVMMAGLVIAAAANAATWEATGDTNAQDMRKVNDAAAEPCVYASQLVQPGETVYLSKLGETLACVQTDKGAVFKPVGSETR